MHQVINGEGRLGTEGRIGNPAIEKEVLFDVDICQVVISMMVPRGGTGYCGQQQAN